MGSGKTTLALKIAQEQGAVFQSLDRTVKDFNEPVRNLSEYEGLMAKAKELMYLRALEVLKNGQSVVFDVAPWPWIYDLAREADALMEIYYFEVSTEERWRRVQKRNREKPENIYHWTMSKEEFDAQSTQLSLPPSVPGLKIIKVTGT